MTETKRYFTVAEATAMIPELEAATSLLLQLRHHIRVVWARLDEAGYAPHDEDDFDVPDAPAEVIGDLVTLKALGASFREEVARLEALGCVVKSVHPALIDWWARHHGRDVFLCWRIGEKAVTWWHDVEAGFAGRRPVAELEPEAGPTEDAS